MIPVKICGITRAKDAHLAARLGAAALGFIFFPPSPRYIAPDRARAVADAIDGRIRKVGVFVNMPLEEINAIVDEVGLDLVQLSGDEPPEACQGIAVPVIKTFHVGADFNPATTHPYDVLAVLLDTSQTGSYGGTGRTFEWSQVNRDVFTCPLILSGGLTPENILDGIEIVRPDAVDVNSGVEASPGVKDQARLEHLFDILKNTEAGGEQVF
ncbi:MAG: phosphoribosylanthranilate isomerase [Fidelibacterota bacterium]|nr:MAG: phosphoribosylanthranilate isomerase [Candidatus Neomarinimicrobiota bacterium]